MSFTDYSKYGSKSAFLFHELLKKDADGRKRIQYKKGDTVFREGLSANGLFCIITGKVKILRNSEGGKEQIVRLAGAREVVGYRALLSDEMYKASAIAMDDTEIGFVPKSVFFEILNHNPEMAMLMMKLLSNDLERSETIMVDMATKPVKNRLAEMLLLLQENFSKYEGVELDIINISREDLAAMVGAAKEVVIRALTALKEEGMIETKGQAIKIKDQQKLKYLTI